MHINVRFYFDCPSKNRVNTTKPYGSYEYLIGRSLLVVFCLWHCFVAFIYLPIYQPTNQPNKTNATQHDWWAELNKRNGPRPRGVPRTRSVGASAFTAKYAHLNSDGFTGPRRTLFVQFVTVRPAQLHTESAVIGGQPHGGRQ